MLSFILILIYFSNKFPLSLSANSQLNLDVNYGENDTIILDYNLTTNSSYYITFRSFGNEQLKFGLFPSTINQDKEHSIEIFYPYSSTTTTTTELFYLFIICFHFISSVKNVDIQCRDIRLLKENQLNSNSSQDFLPSYNPLFVPMMYALSVIMLLPVIIQHHRRKQALLLQRRKELRRLSVTIVQDKENPRQSVAHKFLSQFMENGNINYDHIPLDLELVSAPSTKTILEDIDDNTNIQFTLDSLHPAINKYEDDEETTVDAHDCIEHLLNNTPWNKPYNEQPFGSNLSRHHSVVRDSATAIKEHYVPTIISFPDHYNDDDDDRKPILKSKKSITPSFYRSDRTFLESDV